MSAISITASAVAPVTSSNPVINTGIAGATITQGQPLYLDSTTNTLKLADANDATAYQAIGVSLNAASAGQQVSFQKSGIITIGSTQLAGNDLWLYSTAGTMTVTAGDLVSGFYNVHLGTYLTTTTVLLNITIGGLLA